MSAFCTIDDMADFLQLAIPAGNASALRAITEASAMIQNYCRQVIEQVEDDEYTFDVLAGQTKLFLPQLPVTAVSEVVEDEETLTVEDDYKLGNHGILYRIGGKWAEGIQIVTVTYTHGYPVDDYNSLPDDIVSICTRAAARAYQAGLKAAALAGVPGVQATSIGDYSVQYASDQPGGAAGGLLGISAAPILLPSEKAILDHYRVRGP